MVEGVFDLALDDSWLRPASKRYGCSLCGRHGQRLQVTATPGWSFWGTVSRGHQVRQ